MSIRNILVPVLPNVAAGPQLDTALQLARLAGAHITAVFVRPDAASTLGVVPEAIVAASVTLDEIERAGDAAERRAHLSFKAWQTEHGLESGRPSYAAREIYVSWTIETGFPEAIVTRRGRLSDLIVLNNPSVDPTASGRMFEAAVFETGRPTIIAPLALPATILDHALVAWDGSLEAARAVAGAMGLLRAANKVSVFTVRQEDADPPPDSELAEALLWHGITAQRIAVPDEKNSVGDTLLRAVDDQKASLLVMGGYTHSQLRQMFLGGVTRDVLAKARIPVLMTH